MGGEGTRSDRPVGLADAFRERTRSLHALAERSGIIGQLLQGRASRHGYALFLRNLLPAYQLMELALSRGRQVAALRVLARPAVYRAAALKSDLERLSGPNWKTALPLLPAGQRYARRVAAAAAGDATRIVAHAYVRYLGDLNGGAILKRRLTRSLGLGPEALTFYEFALVSDLSAFKTDYRAAIDQAGQDIVAVDRVINEAAVAFQLNIDVSEAVQAAVRESQGVQRRAVSPAFA